VTASRASDNARRPALNTAAPMALPALRTRRTARRLPCTIAYKCTTVQNKGQRVNNHPVKNPVTASDAEVIDRDSTLEVSTFVYIGVIADTNKSAPTIQPVHRMICHEPSGTIRPVHLRAIHGISHKFVAQINNILIIGKKIVTRPRSK